MLATPSTGRRGPRQRLAAVMARAPHGVGRVLGYLASRWIHEPTRGDDMDDRLDHFETLGLLLRGMLNTWSVVLTVLGVILLIGGGILGPRAGTTLAVLIQAVDPYRLWIAVPLFFISLYIAAHNAISAERTQKAMVVHRRDELEDM